MINIKSLEKRVKKIEPKADLRGTVQFVVEREGKYYDEKGEVCEMGKSDNGIIYISVEDYKKS